MLDEIAEPDGRIGLYENGTLLGYARDQAHADGYQAQYDDALKAAAPALWKFGCLLWDAQPQSERDRINTWVRDTYALAEQMRKREGLSPLADLGVVQQFREMQRAEREELVTSSVVAAKQHDAWPRRGAPIEAHRALVEA